jgi:MHS family alpha-ketoglutarate permease-like MFS transporter
MTSTTTRHERQGVRFQLRQVTAAGIGNIVEWFDWYIYAILATYFAGQFFPSSSDHSLVPLLSTLAIFAVGFLARPIGGLFIGMLADRVGRRATLSWTIIGMGVGSLIIALTPTYAQIGIAAPTLLLLARILQGISTGGEFAAAAAFLVESAPEGRRGLFSSVGYITATTATLLATGLTAFLANTLSAEDMTSWGWRIPFVIGAVGSLIGLWVRRRAEETLVIPDDKPTARAGLFDFFREHPKQAMQVFGLFSAPAAAFYFWASYLPVYANLTVGFDLSKGLLVTIPSLVLFLVLQPIFGMISDKIGRKPLMFGFGGFFVVATVPLLSLLNSSVTSLLVIQATGLVFIAMWTSISSAVACELFPARLRGSGIGFPYALSAAIFGGTAPYLATYLAKIGHPILFGWYLVALAAVALVVYARLPETAHRPLD